MDISLEAVSGQLSFLDQYLEAHPESLVLIKDSVIRVLKSSVGHSLNVMDSFHWQGLAQRLLPENNLEVARLALDIFVHGTERYAIESDILKVLRITLKNNGWLVFSSVLGPYLIQYPRLSWMFQSVITEQDDESILSDLSIENLITWIEEDIQTRLPIIAYFAPVRGRPLAKLTSALLSHWGDHKELESRLNGRFFSGFWVGSASKYWQDKMVDVEEWKKDKNPKVRRWAEKLKISLEKNIAEEKLREEENDLL